MEKEKRDNKVQIQTTSPPEREKGTLNTTQKLRLDTVILFGLGALGILNFGWQKRKISD